MEKESRTVGPIQSCPFQSRTKEQASAVYAPPAQEGWWGDSKETPESRVVPEDGTHHDEIAAGDKEPPKVQTIALSENQNWQVQRGNGQLAHTRYIPCVWRLRSKWWDSHFTPAAQEGYGRAAAPCRCDPGGCQPACTCAGGPKTQKNRPIAAGCGGMLYAVRGSKVKTPVPVTQSWRHHVTPLKH